MPFQDDLKLSHYDLLSCLAAARGLVFDLWPKEDSTHGIHPCIGPGDYEFPRDPI